MATRCAARRRYRPPAPAEEPETEPADSAVATIEEDQPEADPSAAEDTAVAASDNGTSASTTEPPEGEAE